ncbi:MAG: prepilin-type N-terminal cleavage/methylation domain-containing protein [Candidatus Aminicenantes bacterium]|nr:prepilin-type N-terminal cleavage/methylation domain-containing protein [Candidatus Aminicenantes bacterium]
MLKLKQGFTLIELLVVVAIVGILAALLIPQGMAAMQKAKQKGTMKDIGAISTALLDYTIDVGILPAHAGDMDAELQALLAPDYQKVCPVEDQWGNPFAVYCGQAAGFSIRGCEFTSTGDFVVISYGRDGVSDGINYDPSDPDASIYVVTDFSSFANDLIHFDGSWVRRPKTTVDSTG